MIDSKQIEVLQWWHGAVDYQIGIMLLAKYGKNKVLLHTLMKPGKERFGGMQKLQYELPKAVGLDYRKMPELPDSVPTATQTAPPVVQKDVQKDVQKNIVQDKKEKSGKDSHFPYVSAQPLYQYPLIIRKIKYAYSELYKERSVLHKKMVAVGEKNSPFNLKARSKMLAEIKIISKKMDFMYGFVVDYEKKGTVPEEETVWPPAKKPVSALPDDLQELRKMKKNLQTSNTKYRNKLLYQQNSKKQKETPLPPGPKRKRYELKIKHNEKLIVAIDNKMVDMENVD